MSTPQDSTLGFDPLLTGWLAKSNAQKITDQEFTTGNLLEDSFFGPQSLLGQAWDAIRSKANPVEQRIAINQGQVNTALAGGSPADVAQTAKDMQAAFDTAPTTYGDAIASVSGFFNNLSLPAPNIGVNVDWKSVVIVGLVLLLVYVIAKEVL